MATASLDRVNEVLQREGLLLASDAHLPSVTSLVVGEPVKGSWWGHPKAQEIFQVTEELADRRDVTIAKLIAGKVTYVAHPLWPDLVGVGDVEEPWQTEGLSEEAERMRSHVGRRGWLRTDRLPEALSVARRRVGPVVRELERRLLVHAIQVHTESGAHAKLLQSWAHWATAVDLAERREAAVGKATFESILARWNAAGEGHLPWQRKP